MTSEIKTINLGLVNCYLVKTGDGFFLIDTGWATKRTELEKELESAGCKPGNLKLVILTHGDSDRQRRFVLWRPAEEWGETNSRFWYVRSGGI